MVHQETDVCGDEVRLYQGSLTPALLFPIARKTCWPKNGTAEGDVILLDNWF